MEPGKYEKEHSNHIEECIVRPTGLLDPKVSVRKTKGQIEDLIGEINKRVERNERVLITTLTKRMAEDLTSYLTEADIKVEYLHSDVETIERMRLIKNLREGEFDVLVGINLLREGLDIPEVSLVAILDADKEGFLRSETSLIQTIGRAARHLNGEVIMYADTITNSMRAALDETSRRTKIQENYNKEHNITPKGIVKSTENAMWSVSVEDFEDGKHKRNNIKKKTKNKKLNIEEEIEYLTKQMKMYAKNLEFEMAATIRDEIKNLEKLRKKR